jgi:hypothetical protein
VFFGPGAIYVHPVGFALRPAKAFFVEISAILADTANRMGVPGVLLFGRVLVRHTDNRMVREG